jgi:hypothetical protein
VDDGNEIEVDEAALAIMRDHQERLRRLQAQIDSESSYSKRRQLQRDFLTEVKRQEAALSEVPGLEGQAVALSVLRERFQLFYRLD